MNYEDFLSERGNLRGPSPLRRFSRLGRESEVPLINLSPGLPNTELFPLTGMTFYLSNGSEVELSKEDLQVAQNYSNGDGIKPFIVWLQELTVRIHNPPTWNDANDEKKLQVLVNPGGTQGIFSAADLILSKGSKCLILERNFPTFSEALRVKGVEPLRIKLDKDGPDMTHFREILAHWHPENKENWQTRPKLFYVVPNGNNPSGETISTEKRRQIYTLAREYEFLILEDDAYFFLQYDETKPSFLSMDTDGRVIRCDSFAKTLGAGFRLGWVAGPSALVTRMMYDIQVSLQHASVLSQVVMYRTVQQWGVDGFIENVYRVRDFYRRRRNIVVKAAQDYMTGLATWTVPESGVFFWIKLLTIEDTEDLLMGPVLNKGVLLTPGNIFLVEPSLPTSYLRVSFSVAPEEDLAKGIKILAETIREVSDK